MCGRLLVGKSKRHVAMPKASVARLSAPWISSIGLGSRAIESAETPSCSRSACFLQSGPRMLAVCAAGRILNLESAPRL